VSREQGFSGIHVILVVQLTPIGVSLGNVARHPSLLFLGISKGGKIRILMKEVFHEPSRKHYEDCSTIGGGLR
jgi:hypothetical protein